MCVPGFKDFVPGEPAAHPVGTPSPPGGQRKHWGSCDVEMTPVDVCMTEHTVRLIISSAPLPAVLHAAGAFEGILLHRLKLYPVFKSRGIEFIFLLPQD